MLMQTKDLTGPALDWVAAKAKGYADFVLDAKRFREMHDTGHYNYSTNWAQGGPIIEQQCMVSSCFAPAPDSLHYDPANPTRKQWFYWNDRTGMVAGPTPLIAAMRCLVASKLGDTVDVPDELA